MVQQWISYQTADHMQAWNLVILGANQGHRKLLYSERTSRWQVDSIRGHRGQQFNEGHQGLTLAAQMIPANDH